MSKTGLTEPRIFNFVTLNLQIKVLIMFYRNEMQLSIFTVPPNNLTAEVRGESFVIAAKVLQKHQWAFFFAFE